MILHKKWKPSDHERNVGLQMLSYMKFHAGEWITKEVLESEFYVNRRTIRNLMHWLADEMEEPILALSNRKGYLYATDEMISIVEHARRERIGRAIEVLAGNKGIEKKLRRLGIKFEEVSLWVGSQRVL